MFIQVCVCPQWQEGGGMHGRVGACQGVCMAGGMCGREGVHATHTPLADTMATAYGQ